MQDKLKHEQLARQKKAEFRTKNSHLATQRKLKEFGKESALLYGQKLYSYCLESLALELENTFEDYVINPDKARVNGAAIPFFDGFTSAHHIAAVALVATLDQLSRKARIATFCQNLGKAIEDESRLIKLNRNSSVEFRHLIRQGIGRRRIATKDIMRKLGCPVPFWNDVTRLDVGRFLLDHIVPSTGIVDVIKRRIGKTTPRFVVPTQEAEKLIRECPATAYKGVYTAMVCPPNPWNGLYGGGMIDNEECLIRVPIQDHEEKHTTAISHYKTANLLKVLTAINYLQETPLRVDREMVDLQRIAWENGIDGLFPCSRSPMELPERLGDKPTAEDLRLRNRLAAMAHRDREQNRPRRVRIERSLQMAEDLKGRTIWQSYHADHRGRLYTGNKYVTTQGPDTEKALLNFNTRTPVDNTAIEWLMKAAAGHYGLSKKTWKERLSWSKKNLDKIQATAADPLKNIDLWRSADDPWQFLQLCKGISDAIKFGKTDVPVRFDQTTSGCGILSALVRDKKVGRLCNLYGNEPADLYTKVAEQVTARLTHDLQLGDEKEKALAELWLGRGIDRKLTKGPILASPYGGSFMSLCDSLVEALDDHLNYVPLDEFALRVAMPSKYLAKHIWAELKQEISTCMAVKKWLMKVCRIVLSQNIPLTWTAPSGWPMRVADRQPTTRTIRTFLFGKRLNVNLQDQPITASLSATQANKSIGANFAHSFDSAFLISLLNTCEEQAVPVLVNHDCFATNALTAGELHETLHKTMNDMYKEDLLKQVWIEMCCNSGINLPEPPWINTLDANEIGTNPYLFS